jgi:hypothetical protein
MSYSKGTQFMSKKTVSKLESDKKRDERLQQEKAALEQRQREAAQTPSKKYVVMQRKPGSGIGHHCHQKDAASTHVMTQRCFRKRHMGVCSCGLAVASRYGCDACGQSGEQLEYDNIVYPAGFR